jgi:hypothetical protein
MPEWQTKFINLRTPIALIAYGENAESKVLSRLVPALEFSSQCVNKLVRDLLRGACRQFGIARNVGLGRFLGFHFCCGGSRGDGIWGDRLSARIKEGRIERSGERIGIYTVGNLREQKFIPEPIRMILASEQNQEAPHFRIGVDNYAVSHGYIRDDQAMKLAAVTIHAGVYSIENFYMQNGSLGQDADGICI